RISSHRDDEPWPGGRSRAHTQAMEPRLDRPTPPTPPAAAEPARIAGSSYPRWWLVLGVWAAWGLVLSRQVDLYSRMAGKPMAFHMAFRLNMPGALVWALFTPGIIWLGRRYPPFEMQLQPTFPFNALHTIGQLVRTGQASAAVDVVARLGDLLRRVLDAATAQEVPMQEELDFIASYLEIEPIRFRDRLDVSVDV